MTSAIEQEAKVRQFISEGKMRAAAEACDELNQQFPDYESGWYTASHLAMQIKDPMLAVRAIDRALQLSPGRPEWLFYRVECLGALGNLAEARATAEKLSGHVFESDSVCVAFAHTLSRLGLHEDARAQCVQAVKLKPDESRYHYSLAMVERFLGNGAAADAAVARCLELSPDEPDAHLLRATIKTQSPDDNHVAELEAAHERMHDEPQKQVRICHALAKELEDIGEFDRSWKYLSQGAQLRRAGYDYSLQNDLDAINAIIETYTAEMFDDRVHGHVNAEPIFIIGMPRTGNTLVDQILGAHSVVQSAGELPAFSHELIKHCRQLGGDKPNSAAAQVMISANVDFEQLGVDYVAAARPRDSTVAHFTNRLPMNFLYAGLIHLALPKARIVLLDRDPMDTCYAIYKSMFGSVYPFANDLNEIAEYFNAYRRLINHWQTVMPDVMHVVKYEELVTDPRPVIEDLLDYCGLSFEEGCLKYYESGQMAASDGTAQVRSDFFQSSVGKWRNFEKQLAPFSKLLDEGP